MPEPAISRIPIYARDAAESSPERRWECCRISADLASALDIPLDRLRAGRVYQVRVSVTSADVNMLYNPGYVEFLDKSESFIVEGLTRGSQRIEIYANSGPGSKDGGVYRLFGGGNPFAGISVPTNARVSLSLEAVTKGRRLIERGTAASAGAGTRFADLTSSLQSV